MRKMQDSRLNTHLADLVDRCIVLSESDRERAIAIMMAAAVPDRVIARVLCEPDQRRTRTVSAPHWHNEHPEPGRLAGPDQASP